MDSDFLMILFFVGALAFWGWFGPAITGSDTYHMRKWRAASVLFAIFFVWILLTPNGCGA